MIKLYTSFVNRNKANVHAEEFLQKHKVSYEHNQISQTRSMSREELVTILSLCDEPFGGENGLVTSRSRLTDFLRHAERKNISFQIVVFW